MDGNVRLNLKDISMDMPKEGNLKIAEFNIEVGLKCDNEKLFQTIMLVLSDVMESIKTQLS